MPHCDRCRQYARLKVWDKDTYNFSCEGCVKHYETATSYTVEMIVKKQNAKPIKKMGKQF